MIKITGHGRIDLFYRNSRASTIKKKTWISDTVIDFLSYRMALESQNSAHDLICNVGKPLFLGLSQHCNSHSELSFHFQESLKRLKSLSRPYITSYQASFQALKYSGRNLGRGWLANYWKTLACSSIVGKQVSALKSWDSQVSKVTRDTLKLSDSRGVEPRKILRSSYRFENENSLKAKCKQAFKKGRGIARCHTFSCP